MIPDSPDLSTVVPVERPIQGPTAVMKVRASVRRMCDKCKIVKRRGVVFVVCADPRHKQRQG